MWQTILNSVKNFVFNFFKSAAAKQLQILVPLFLDIVRQIEADPSIVINGDKRGTAIENVLVQLGEKEKDFPKYLLNLSLELAVAEVKEFGK